MVEKKNNEPFSIYVIYAKNKAKLIWILRYISLVKQLIYTHEAIGYTHINTLRLACLWKKRKLFNLTPEQVLELNLFLLILHDFVRFHIKQWFYLTVPLDFKSSFTANCNILQK